MHISHTFHLAEELGGKGVTLPGHSAEATQPGAHKRYVNKGIGDAQGAHLGEQPRWRWSGRRLSEADACRLVVADEPAVWR